MVKYPQTTVEDPHITELVIKRSRFITYSARIATVALARDYLKALRLQLPGVTHIPWAYFNKNDNACGDDGEPHGSSGRPILNVLQYSGFTEIFTGVARYFGGIKLGLPNLKRAYEQSARENLASLPWTEATNLIKIECGYKSLERIDRALSIAGIKANWQYGTPCLTELYIPQSSCEAIKNEVLKTGGTFSAVQPQESDLQAGH